MPRALLVLPLLFALCGHAQGDTLTDKTLLRLEEQTIWEGISADGKLLPEHAYLRELDLYAITYTSEGHAVHGFLVEPKAPGRYPVVLFNRGGNRDFAALDIGTMVNYTAPLAQAGFVILASNYRAADEFGGAEINDVLKLIDICPSIAKVDTARIGMFGWSRGGMMTYLALARTTRLRTAVVGNGPTDLRATLIERPGLEESVFSQCIPDYWATKDAALSQRSVVDWPERLCPSTSLLILCGTLDRRVDHAQAEALASKLDSTGHRYELKSYETDHFFSDHKAELHQALIAWFRKELAEAR